MDALALSTTAFSGSKKLLDGSLLEVALAVKELSDLHGLYPQGQQVLVFNDLDGSLIDLDLSGNKVHLIQSIAKMDVTDVVKKNLKKRDAVQSMEMQNQNIGLEPAKRGRPKLGVVGKEVTLLPRHWDWLAEQSGGASVALRKLIDQARKSEPIQDQHRKYQESAYRFMSAMAGDLENFEEASRCLFAMDIAGLKHLMLTWPQDVQGYILQLLQLTDS